MKIGQFAKKYETTHDTIRYYIEKGLLVPNKKDGQFRFNEVDCNEFEKIVQLKQMHFSLSDIHRILTFQRLGGDSTEFSRKQFLLELEEKQRHINSEIERYREINDYLCIQIDKLKSYEQEEYEVLGFPIHSTELLVCPCCKKSLNLTAGIFESNMILNAVLDCNCGYQGKIKEGIYIDERDVRTKLVNGKPMPSKEEYFMESDYDHISHLFRGMAQLIEYMNKYQKKPKYIMELSNCVGFYLLQYIHYLPEEAVYILVDFDLERMRHIKKNLEKFYKHRKFIFLCCEHQNIPLVNECVDTVVDLYMINVLKNIYNKSLHHIASTLMKTSGILVGSSLNYIEKEISYIPTEWSKHKNERKDITYDVVMGNVYFKVLDFTEISSSVKEHNNCLKGQVTYNQKVYVARKE